MKALNFYNKYTKKELIELAQTIENNEENHEQPGGLLKLKKSARKTLAEIRQAIAWHMEDDRRRAGNPVPTCGYSGRQTNRGA